MKRMFTKEQLEQMIEEGHIILTSPDGSKWKITVSNTGTIKAEKLVK